MKALTEKQLTGHAELDALLITNDNIFAVIKDTSSLTVTTTGAPLWTTETPLWSKIKNDYNHSIFKDVVLNYYQKSLTEFLKDLAQIEELRIHKLEQERSFIVALIEENIMIPEIVQYIKDATYPKELAAHLTNQLALHYKVDLIDKNESQDPKVLEPLLKHPHVNVRKELVRFGYFLDRLQHDKSPTVRKMVANQRKLEINKTKGYL